MSKPKKKKSKKKHRNLILAVILKEDHRRLKERTVLPEKGSGGKRRPRIKKVKAEDFD